MKVIDASKLTLKELPDGIYLVTKESMLIHLKNQIGDFK